MLRPAPIWPTIMPDGDSHAPNARLPPHHSRSLSDSVEFVHCASPASSSRMMICFFNCEAYGFLRDLGKSYSLRMLHLLWVRR